MDFNTNSQFADDSPLSYAEYQVRVVMIGNTQVGKTSLVLKYFRNSFSEDVQSTIGASVFTRVCTEDDKKIIINYYDTAGQETYRSLGKLYYRNCACAILVFDVTDKKSFDDLESWVKEFRSHSASNAIFIAGNKSDLKDKQVITLEDAIDKAQQLGCQCIFTSAADGTGVSELFHTVNAEIIETLKKQWTVENTQRVVALDDHPKQRGCC